MLTVPKFPSKHLNPSHKSLELLGATLWDKHREMVKKGLKEQGLMGVSHPEVKKLACNLSIFTRNNLWSTCLQQPGTVYRSLKLTQSLSISLWFQGWRYKGWRPTKTEKQEMRSCTEGAPWSWSTWRSGLQPWLGSKDLMWHYSWHLAFLLLFLTKNWSGRGDKDSGSRL